MVNVFCCLHGTSVRCQSFVTDSVFRLLHHFSFTAAYLITSQWRWGCDRDFHCSQFIPILLQTLWGTYLPSLTLICTLPTKARNCLVRDHLSILYFFFYFCTMPNSFALDPRIRSLSFSHLLAKLQCQKQMHIVLFQFLWAEAWSEQEFSHCALESFAPGISYPVG